MATPQPKTVVLLGGFGNLGKTVAESLLRETDAPIKRLGRSLPRVNDDGSSGYAFRLQNLSLDAADESALTEAFQNTRAVIVCTTGSDHTHNILRAAMAAHIDVIDLRYPREVHDDLARAAPEIEKAGIRVFSQAGHLPGLASVFYRYAVARISRPESFTIATGIRMSRPASLGAAEEMVHILQTSEPPGGNKMPRRIYFGPPFGSLWCFPTASIELEALAGAPVYVGGMNPFVSFCLAPLALAVGKKASPETTRRLGHWFAWGINTFQGPPYGAVMNITMTGQNGSGRRAAFHLTALHESSYHLAAASVTAFIKPYLSNAFERPGLHLMGLEVDPAFHLEAMKRSGIVIREEQT